DTRGKSIGINAAYDNNRGITRPINKCKTGVDKLMQDRKIKHAYLGIVADSIRLPENIARQPDINQPGGLIIYNVEQDSAAKKAGLAMGDVVVKLDGKQVQDLMDLHEMLDDKAIRTIA